MEITPALAEEWLTSNTHNRDLKRSGVKKFVDVIKSGGWKVTHQGIAFDWNGTLLDGQHRLWAIWESGVTVTMYVTYGMDPDTYMVIDSGPAGGGGKRSLGDAFAVSKWANSRTVAERTRALFTIMNPARTGSSGPSTKELIPFAAAHKAQIEWINAVLPRDKRGIVSSLSQATVSAGWMYAYAAAPDIQRYVHNFKSGANLSGPLLAFRTSLVGRIWAASNQADRLILSLRTLNVLAATHMNKPLSKIFGSSMGVDYFSRLAGDNAVLKAYSDWTIR